MLVILMLATSCQVRSEMPLVLPNVDEQSLNIAPKEPSKAELAMAAGNELVGIEYVWGGRNTEKNPGIDCLGLLYLAWGSVTNTPWREYSVNPSSLVTSKKLGSPVKGLDGVLRQDLDVSLLELGDVLYFLMADYKIPDKPLMIHDGVSYWPWHTGLFAGEGRVLHAQPGGRVRHQDLVAISFDALYVTRIP